MTRQGQTEGQPRVISMLFGVAGPCKVFSNISMLPDGTRGGSVCVCVCVCVRVRVHVRVCVWSLATLGPLVCPRFLSQDASLGYIHH